MKPENKGNSNFDIVIIFRKNYRQLASPRSCNSAISSEITFLFLNFYSLYQGTYEYTKCP